MVTRFEGAVSAARRYAGNINGTAPRVDAASNWRRVVVGWIIGLDLIEWIWDYSLYGADGFVCTRQFQTGRGSLRFSCSARCTLMKGICFSRVASLAGRGTGRAGVCCHLFAQGLLANGLRRDHFRAATQLIPSRSASSHTLIYQRLPPSLRHFKNHQSAIGNSSSPSALHHAAGDKWANHGGSALPL